MLILLPPTPLGVCSLSLSLSDHTCQRVIYFINLKVNIFNYLTQLYYIFVLFCIFLSQGSLEGENTYTYIIEISLLDYEGWKGQWSSICKLKNQETWWYNSVQVQKVANGISPSPSWKTQEPGMPMSNARIRWMSQHKQKAILLYCFVLFRPSVDLVMPFYIVEVRSLYTVYWF